ncbi:hypothetical protein APHAL10511_004145 [Amanita phalloides]|nr:hypothetical protein APHAL10511_004145 [Amanita phalloides]
MNSSEIIEDIKQKQLGAGLAYFYFDINEEAKQKPKSFLSVLVLAFSASSGNYSPLEKLYEKQFYCPIESNLLEVLKELMKGFKLAYIIVDAFDECQAYGELFKMIRVIYGWKMSSCHILVTSRREERVILAMHDMVL